MGRYLLSALVRRFFCVLSLCFLIFAPASHAVITGRCDDCHTMHNSQNGSSMVSYVYPGESATAQPYLTRGTCVGCHAMGTGASKIETIGSNPVPQIYHDDASGDLAGGNFAYIDGIKGSGATGAKGHNVIDLFGVGSDENLDWAPGHTVYHGGPNSSFRDTTLRCSGALGCHGIRDPAYPGIKGISGAHHNNVDGQLTTASTVGNSYRFLKNVYGLENPTATPSEKWQNIDAGNHNEYYGGTTPQTITCSTTDCHASGTGAQPYTHTMSGFCGTCHNQYHSIGDGMLAGVGIGTDNMSPFLRHPTDVVINTKGPTSEYANYTTYEVTVPVGRQAVPASANSVVDPASDTVTCLSCHFAHGSDYPDMLRWDYSIIETGTTGAGAGTGCFICHSNKDG